jgi:DNA polymerase elongation subunit (family B)
MASPPLCGLWVGADGQVYLSRATPEGGREESTVDGHWFAWVGGEPPAELTQGITLSPLQGQAAYPWLSETNDLAAHEQLVKGLRGVMPVDNIKPYESQVLLHNRQRLFAELRYGDLRRCQLDIETASQSGEFSDPTEPGDRVLAIGLHCDGRDRTLVLAEDSDEAERALLTELNAVLADEDPDTIEGHNIFKFDLDYLRRRAKRFKVPCQWGRFGQVAKFRNSRLKVAERWIDFPRCDLPGRTVVDTFLLVQLYDVSTRELEAFGLKDVARHFGVTPADGGDRTYLPGNEIQHAFTQDRKAFLAYLADDLRETRGIADILLPTYFEQVKTFPITLQEATLRGTTGKIDMLFLEHYYHARQATPLPPPVEAFAGGFSRSFQEGVFRHVLHFDVASLYPSLLLHLDRNPANDVLGVFIPMLRELREYRLHYKQLARSAPTPEERAEAEARQTSFKILINSFYGYLGFSGARFGDGELAAEITLQGRELLQALIAKFDELGATILEADTDGIYLSSEEHYEKPEVLLERVDTVLPEGIELEFDGSYEAMFCYKAKNYALYDGDRIILKGSALRSRGIEPYLKKLSERLIAYLLGFTTDSPAGMLQDYREGITKGETPVADLAKTETLSQNPETYASKMAAGGKPRRASAEVALTLDPQPRMGDRVSYYILPRQKGQTANWQRARAVEKYDPGTAPYDPSFYLKKLDEWVTKYGPFLDEDVSDTGEAQGELF